MNIFLHIVISLSVIGMTFSPVTVAAKPQTYTIDSNHTHVSFTVKRFGFADTLAIFPTSSGIITVDEGNPENSSVMAKVETGDVWSGLIAREDSINSEGFLNTEKFPEITFVSNSVILDAQDNTRAVVAGELTILGQSHLAYFDVMLNRIAPDITKAKPKAVGFSMTSTIKRSDFGNTTAANFIGNEVRITIETIAHLTSEP